MKAKTIPGALAVLALTLVLVTTRALAEGAFAGTQAPGGTPGAPMQGSTPTGTWVPGPGVADPPKANQPESPNQPVDNRPPQAAHGKPTIYRGTLTAVDASSITVALADGSSITLALTADTRIKVPGPNAQGNTLLVGMQVVVQTVADGSGNLVARSVMAIPGKPTRMHRVGTVTAYAAGSSISIMAVDGNTYAFQLTAETKILPAERAGQLAVGSRVTVIAPRDPAATGPSAAGIVVHPAPVE